jgi:CRP-like cAMP-binding protein
LANVAVINREAVLSMTKYNRRVVEKLWSEIISECLRQEQHIVWLGSSANERVASFLLTMADRCGQSGLVELPITRRELSDYLGLTVETVSRVVTSFRSKGAIAIVKNSNRIEILDRDQLKRDAGSA